MPGRINLAMVPKHDSGHIDYRQISSVPVRVMVAEEEIQKLERWVRRVENHGDALRATEEEVAEVTGYLKNLKKWHAEWQELLAEPG
ncbi:hypothetical protein [Endozoicomonas sp.]|uniref:hypothetical protein n=1 Tax=Endozoicomonas sp. TaxID=1892382 RepID=UPI00288748CB|nr:hypothetical protein [Endozoicomonas sp.]